MHTLLGFDFGKQRIGIAVGQSITGTATALRTLCSHNGKPDWEAITSLVEEWRPTALVVGLPLHADGSDSNMTSAARKFARQLEARYRLPVHTMDERLSSHAARQLQQEGRHGTQAGIDAAAAMIILQNWLESEHGHD